MKRKKTVFYGKATGFFLLLYQPYAFLRKLFRPDKKTEIPERPKVLLCCFASLGDVFLASRAVDSVRTRWPGAVIGFVCAPGSFCVAETIEGIAKIHQIPSWMDPGKGKIRNLLSLAYFSVRIYPKAIRELRTERYDLSIELHPFFPNCLPIVRKAKISPRIAFRSGGYEPWITDPVDFPLRQSYLPDLYPLLVFGASKPVDPFPETVLVRNSRFKNRLIILHPGTSDSRKLWGKDHWRAVAESLSQKGYDLVITGKGDAEAEYIKESGLESFGKNLCNGIEYRGLVELIKEAAAVVTIDSLPVHLAAFFGVPFVGLYLYNTATQLWLPRRENGVLLIGPGCRGDPADDPPGAVRLGEIVPDGVLTSLNKILGEKPL